LKKLFIVFICFIAFSNWSFAPVSDATQLDTSAKLKAVFIYNFTKYIEWPADYQSGEFTIGILGTSDALFSELVKMSKVRKVSNQSFSIQSFKNISDVQSPHILYIPQGSDMNLSKAVGKLKGKSTLIVTEKPGLAKQGSAINFIFEGNKQKFELNKTNIENHNLKVASTLEKLAVMVN
jgi:hypothetical protein